MAKQSEAKAVALPVYSVEEFAASPNVLGVKSPDIIRAAMKLAGKEHATVDEAKRIVTTFKNKEVK